MSAFNRGCKVEREGLRHILKYLNDKGLPYTPTDGHLVAQKLVGDLLVKVMKQDTRAVEIKVEQRNDYGNLFLESWSNRSRGTRGWMDTIAADLLWYYFLDDRILYSVDVTELKQWAFGGEGQAACVVEYEEKPQKRYEQANDTWGWCVPIETLRRELVSFRQVSLGPYVDFGEKENLPASQMGMFNAGGGEGVGVP